MRRFLARFLQSAIFCWLVGCCMLAVLASPAFGATGYVRVNQIGYEAGLEARAYLMTTSPVSGVSFAVKNSGGQTVASGSVGAKLGAWGSYTVYAIDFMLSAADTYTISVSAPVAATSPAFRVDTPANLYTAPLANNLYFYENERDGPDFILTPLRSAAGHLNDEHAAVYSSPVFDSDDNIIGSLSPTGATINAEGGWWDAGDYLKFVQTESYVVALMLIGARDFPHQMGSGSTTSNFRNEALFGLQWLQRMWDDSSETLYYQVGIGTDFESYSYLSDHDIWRLPQRGRQLWRDGFDVSVHSQSSGVCGWRRRDRRSALTLPEDWRLISRNVFRFSRRRILRWRISACSRQSIFSTWRISLPAETC